MKEQQFEAILRQALRPEIRPEEITVHVRPSGKGNYMTRFIKKACIAAAAVLLLTTTVSAADSLNIKTLLTGGASKTFSSISQAEQKAGFEIDDTDTFSNGYTFESARVNETKALDKDDQVRLTYNEINADYCNASGDTLVFIAHQVLDALPDSQLAPDQARRIGDIVVSYRVDHYKFVPADYELTEADNAMLQQPGYFLSYGSETVQETDVAFLLWEKEGIDYTLMDQDADETADSLFSMAEELILNN